MTYTTQYTSSIGILTLASDGKHLTGLWIEGQKYFGSTLKKPIIQNGETPVLQAAKKWLDNYFSGECPSPSLLPIILDGTLFQKEVWSILLTIPYGETMTYGAIASTIASNRGIKSMSAQAVGNAVGKNPISIIVPCHRVIGNDGQLTGYAGGIDRKHWFLAHENKTYLKKLR